MESETASSVEEHNGGLGGGSATPVAGTRGKHRIHAELKRVEQEIKFLEVSCVFKFLAFLLFDSLGAPAF
uniref:Guanine nucleotide-binding protein subunit gamma 1 n=1 Tax=Rhizophora mucronata TaxID=61149 RepID=A0A2P2JRQ3_RHIMU